MTDAGAGRPAQRPRFPKTLGDLTDPSKCPSCFETYGAPGASCPSCGFTRDPAVIGHLLDLGAQAREPLLARGEFIVAAGEQARAKAAAALRAEQARAEQSRLESERQGRAQASEAVLAADHARLLGGAAGHLGAEATAVPQQAPADRWAEAHVPAAGQAPPAQRMPPTHPDQPQRPRRSSVQLLLLVLGIGLLSIAAVVFLTFAWVVFGVEVKAAITAGVTLAVVATASILKRRKLSATAEGIAALGIVLVVLDVWAVQATGLFGAGRVPGTLYWGVGLLVATAAFETWHRLAHLRAPGIAASLTVLPAIALTVAGATSAALSPVQRLVLALVLAGAASALHVLLRVKQSPPTTAGPHPPTADAFSAATPRSLERWILSVMGVVALAAGVLSGAAAATGKDPWLGYAVLFVIAAASAALLAWLVSRERGALGGRTLLVAFGVLSSLALGAVPLSFTGPVRLALSLALIPVALAAGQVLRARLANSAESTASSVQIAVTAWSWTTVGAAVVPVLSLALDVLPLRALLAFVSADQAGMAEAFAGAQGGTWWAIASGAVGLALAAGLLLLVPGRLQRLTPALTAAGSFLALCAAASTPGPFGVTIANLAIAAGAVVGAALLARNLSAAPQDDPHRVGLLVTLRYVAGAGILASILPALAAAPFETAALVAAAALTFCLRFSVPTSLSALRPVLTALTALQLLAVPLLVAFAHDAWSSSDVLGTNLAVTCAYLGIALLLTAAVLLPRPWLASAERTLLAYSAAIPTLAASFVLLAIVRAAANRADGDALLTASASPLGSLWYVGAALGALLVATISVVALRRRQDDDVPAVAPLLPAMVPALWATLGALASAFVVASPLPAVAASLGVVASLLVAGGTLVARLRGALASRVLPAELAVAAVAVVALASTPAFTGALGQPAGAQYVAGTIAIAATVPVLLAIAPSGLFQARGRAFLAWIGVGLLTAAWYVFAIGTPSIDTADRFHLPAGIPLAAAALLLWWFGRARSAREPARAAAYILAGGLAVSTVAPAVASGDTTANALAYFLAGAAVALAVAASASTLGIPAHARPLLISLSAVSVGVAVLSALSHLGAKLRGEANRDGLLTGLLPGAEALIWLTACVLLVSGVTWLLLRPVWSADTTRSRRKLLLAMVASLSGALTVALLLTTRFDGRLLLLGLALLAGLLAAGLPTRILTGVGRASIALVSFLALASQGFAIAIWEPTEAASLWVQQQAGITSLLVGVIATAAVVVVRTFSETRLLTRLASYATGVLGSWMLIHHVQLVGFESATPVQLAATAGVLGALTALLGVLLSPQGTRRGDGIALRAFGLVTALLGTVLAPSAAAASRTDGFDGWTPLPLAAALVAVTAVVASTQLGARSPYALLRYLGVPVLALAWVWEVLANWDGASIFVAFGGAFLVLLAAGIATAKVGRRADEARASSVESLLWLAAAPGVWLSAGALAAVSQPRDGDTSRILSLTVPELALSVLTLTLVVVCAIVPVAGWMRASANALGVGSAISAAVLGPALVLAAEGPLTPITLPIWGVIPAGLVLIFASALWRRQQQLENPRLAALAATVLVPVAIASLVLSAFPSILRGVVENNQQLALTWVVALCGLTLVALLRPELLPSLAPAHAVPGAQPSLRVPVLAFSAATLVATAGALGTQFPIPWLELATAPLGATLLAGGLFFLVKRPTLRSWPALTPGLVLLLAPSYLAQFADPAPWRLIALGLLAVGITVWGATRRLQAPLVFGAIITVLHAVTAFRQQLAIVADVIPWWVWLALAGTVLVVIATTYEARLRDAKRAAASISALR
ncbi:hypothetical protein HDC34_002871 [Pseudoclavibacter sp. JAI123]|uniref:SCO7613 C-terminal domain-containing membrane protein n=1 Tax=Pseudoclavibacter sp. JAI123 TaxID=2723065 RepID=UPI0015CAB156|nr:hypothetical protein [Pseudoclavibacter sp. JAI123]NYF14544.1 hypothetical protein [Pseudoclavibacter sp. JAI123]